MSAVQYPVAGAIPQGIRIVGYPSAATVQNTSMTDTLYLVDTPSNNGFPLSPGSVITWDKNRPLYLYTASGVTILVNIVDNDGVITDAGAIAGQIIAQGLALDIATQIVATGLTASNIANLITLNGVPPIDKQVNLLAQTFVSGTGAVGFNVDTTKYQSLSIDVREYGSAGTTVPVPRIVDLLWGGTYVDGESFMFTDDKGNIYPNTGHCTYQTSVKNKDLYVNIGPTSQIGNTVQITIDGSLKTLPLPRYVNRSPYFGVGPGNSVGAGYDGMVAWSVPSKAAAPFSIANYPSTRNGPTTVSISSSTITGAARVILSDLQNTPDSSILDIPMPVSAGPFGYSTTIYLPPRPHSFILTGAGTNMRISLYWP